MAAKPHGKSDNQHAERNHDEHTEQDDGREQEAIGCASLRRSCQRRYAGFGFGQGKNLHG